MMHNIQIINPLLKQSNVFIYRMLCNHFIVYMYTLQCLHVTWRNISHQNENVHLLTNLCCSKPVCLKRNYIWMSKWLQNLYFWVNYPFNSVYTVGKERIDRWRSAVYSAAAVVSSVFLFFSRFFKKNSPKEIYKEKPWDSAF